jgi:hypothetical protein
MSTVQQIIDRAFAKSSASRPNTQAAPQELVDVIGQCLLETALMLSRECPDILGAIATANFSGTGWPRPADAIRVLRLRADAGTIAAPSIAVLAPITVVPFDDPLVAAGEPCLMEFGQAFVPTGQAVDPSAGSIQVMYARLFAMPATINDVIDALFPSMFDPVLHFHVAAFLATKDKRSEDAQAFLAFKAGVLVQMIDWAKTQTYEIVQRFPKVTPPLTNTNEGRAQPKKGEPG